MEFFSDSPNIQIKSSETYNSSQLNQNLIFKYNNIQLEQINKKSFYMIDCNINLNDYYLINNVKINSIKKCYLLNESSIIFFKFQYAL